MGGKLSAINGVKSNDFTQPGNAVNEIWAGDTEIISRLPFGDNDMEQAGWPKNGMPKIPWHNFIIPMKRDIIPPPRYNHSFYLSNIYEVQADQMVCCNRDGCISDQKITSTVITQDLVAQDPSQLLHTLLISFVAWRVLRSMRKLTWETVPSFNKDIMYTKQDMKYWAHAARIIMLLLAIGSGIAYWAILALDEAGRVYQFKSHEWLLLKGLLFLFLVYQILASVNALAVLFATWLTIFITVFYRRRLDEARLHDIVDDKLQFPQNELQASV